MKLGKRKDAPRMNDDRYKIKYYQELVLFGTLVPIGTIGTFQLSEIRITVKT